MIVIGTGARNRREGEIGMTTLGDAQIPVSKTVKSLGITVDDKLSFNTHVDNVCKAAHFHIRALLHIRGYIDEETACMVASSMVRSRLDYCNCLCPCLRLSIYVCLNAFAQFSRYEAQTS